MTLRSPSGTETIGRILLVVVGIVLVIVGDWVLGIIAIVIGLVLLLLPRLGGGTTRL